MRTARRGWISAFLAMGVLLLAVPVVWALGGGGGRDESPLVIGHRGAAGYLPDHTLEGYELAIKLALAVASDDVDLRAVIQAQRSDSMRALQDYTRLKARGGDGDLAWLLVLDAMVFQTEAELRWLDHCESRLVQARRHPRPRSRRAVAADEVVR